MSAPVIERPDPELVELIRQEFASADQNRQPRPGRPTLARSLGVSEHQVRQAIASIVASETSDPPTGAIPTALSLVTTPGEAGAPAPARDSPAVTSDAPGVASHPASGAATPITAGGSRHAAVTNDGPTSPAVASDTSPGPPAITSSPAVASPTSPAVTKPPVHRAWLLLLALPAFVAVWGGWVGLGGLVGFGPVVLLPGIADHFTVNLAVTLPAGMEAYAVIGLRVWLSSATRSTRTRLFAMRSAIAALTVGCLGQVAYHVLARPVTGAPLPVTIFVACLPVAILGMGAALFHLVSDDQRTAEEAAKNT